MDATRTSEESPEATPDSGTHDANGSDTESGWLSLEQCFELLTILGPYKNIFREDSQLTAMTRLFKEVPADTLTRLVNFFEIGSTEDMGMFNDLIDAFALHHVRSIVLIGDELGVI